MTAHWRQIDGTMIRDASRVRDEIANAIKAKTHIIFVIDRGDGPDHPEIARRLYAHMAVLELTGLDRDCGAMDIIARFPGMKGIPDTRVILAAAPKSVVPLESLRLIAGRSDIDGKDIVIGSYDGDSGRRLCVFLESFHTNQGSLLDPNGGEQN